MVMAKKSQVKFRLFEKNGSIRIAIQTVPEQDENNSNLNTSAEYYIASDPRNVSKILDTLVSTVKDVSIHGDSLYTNYRKSDTFIIEDYERLRNHPELRPFFDKMGRKIKHQEENRKNKKKTSSKRKNIRFGKRVLAVASLFTTVLIAGLFKSDMMAQEATSDDALVFDNNDEAVEAEIEEVLEKYQASIIENEWSESESIESEQMAQADESVPVMEEMPEETMPEETSEETVEVLEETTGEDSQMVEESTDSTSETIEEKKDESQKEEEEEKEETKQEDKEKEETETKSTDETTLAKVDETAEEEVDKEIEKIATELVAQNKTSEEDVKAAAETALQDGQVQVEVAEAQTETLEQTQVATASVTDNATPAMNANGTGINYVETYHLTPEQIDIIKATIQHEAGFNPVEVEKVTSVVINRCESGGWPGGTNPYGVIVGKGQFQSYYAGYYKKYLNGNYADYTDQIVDAMLLGEQVPSHDFERFSSGSGATGTQFTENGNKFR